MTRAHQIRLILNRLFWCGKLSFSFHLRVKITTRGVKISQFMLRYKKKYLTEEISRKWLFIPIKM
ncbi:hypothetical protein HZS_5165 [Henneguya salminicola]|nr:hypothetical protein HZS_5165 [Henneguya salminicola]